MQDFKKMQDITIEEQQLFVDYYDAFRRNDISKINEILTNNPNLKYKIFNEFNWNRLIGLVNDQTETESSTYDSLVGQWSIDYKKIKDASINFVFVGIWEVGKSYKKGNLVKVGDYLSFFCIQDHISSLNNKPNNNSYWIKAQDTSKQIEIKVSNEIPTDLLDKEIFFKIV